MSQQDPKAAAAKAAAQKAAQKSFIEATQSANGITKDLMANLNKLGTIKGAILAYKEYPDRHVVIAHDDIGPNKFEFAKA
jgi:hypothetical protein